MQESGIDRHSCVELLKDFCRVTESLLRKINEQNPIEAGCLLHQIKGSAANVRAKNIEKLCIQAEEILKSNDGARIKMLYLEIQENLKKISEKQRE